MAKKNAKIVPKNELSPPKREIKLLFDLSNLVCGGCDTLGRIYKVGKKKKGNGEFFEIFKCLSCGREFMPEILFQEVEEDG